MDAVYQAADMMFGENSDAKWLNLKFATAGRGKAVPANQLAQMVVDSEIAMRSGKARLVTEIG